MSNTDHRFIRDFSSYLQSSEWKSKRSTQTVVEGISEITEAQKTVE